MDGFALPILPGTPAEFKRGMVGMEPVASAL